MAKSISVITKKGRGRPVTTGKGTLIGVRLLDDPMASLDAWIKRQKEADLSRPEAIRRLVELGLTVKQTKSKSPTPKAAARAAELAAKAIEKRIDPAAPAEEREVRKRELIQGPSPFREARKDRPGK